MRKKILNLIKRSLFKIRYFFMRKKLIKKILKEEYILIKTTKKDRHIGKTTLISELSKTFNATVLVKYKKQEEMFKRLGVNNVMHVPNYESFRGRRIEGFYLVDEGFDSNDLSALKSQYNLVGFYYERS